MNRKQYLQEIENVIAQGPYADTWSSLCEHPQPYWHQQDKFGIFIHWGLYSVPAFGNEWYPRNMYRKYSPEYNHHVKTYGELSEFGYKDFIPMFKAEKFNADEWLDLFEEAGARFVMPVAEHHEGFQMYDSALSPWNAKQMGPCKDILADLKKATEDRNMTFCASTHRAEHWWFFDEGRSIPEADVNDPQYATLYAPAVGPTHNVNTLYDNPPDEAFLEDWLLRTCELVDKYTPKIVYFDWWIQNYAFKPYLRKFAAFYYNRAVQWNKDVTIAAKFDAYVHGSCTKDIERGQMSHITPDFWQNDTSVAKNSWGYTKNNNYKDAYDIICDLCDVVSKNGALLLNIGPKADGTIPKEDAHLLREVGKWLKINGEAIYGTRCWKLYGEGPTEVPEGHFTDVLRKTFTEKDLRFTAKADAIYAIVLKWPEDGVVHIRSLGKDQHNLKTTIRYAEILGHGVRPRVEYRDSIMIRANIKADDYPVVIKLCID